MKTVFKILMLLAIAAVIIYSFIGVDDKADERRCTGMELEVDDSLSLGLISQDEVEAIVKKKHINPEGERIADLNLAKIEQTLCESPYIDTVDCDLTASGKVHLTVIANIPAMHVMAANEEEYYLARHGKTMPIGNITGNLPIATGHITRDYARKELSKLARIIQDSAFWRAQVQQIEVVNRYDVRMYTRIADHVVLLGDLNNLPDKLWRLRIFYEKGLPETGWNMYETVNVAYKDIVVGKRKNWKPSAPLIPVAPATPAATGTDQNGTTTTATSTTATNATTASTTAAAITTTANKTTTSSTTKSSTTKKN